MSTIVDVPLDFSNGVARDAKLLELTQEFCKAEFGNEYPFSQNLKSWVTVELEDDQSYKVLGVTSIRGEIDVCLLHIKRPSDREQMRTAEQVRDRMVTRLVHWVQDNYGMGKPVFVYIDPSVERLWRKFLRFIKAEPANRVIVRS